MVDLQGWKKDEEYVLTDPAVHCKTAHFGQTNLGDVGHEQFFDTHRCNAVCEKMGLTKRPGLRSEVEKIIDETNTLVL